MAKTTALQVRGSTVAAARLYSRPFKDTPEHEQFLAELTQSEREFYEGEIKRSRWYPVALYNGMLSKAASCFASDAEEEFLSDGGRFVVDDGVNGLYKAFFRVASPGFVLRGSALLWRMFFKGNKLKIKSSGKGYASAHLVGSNECYLPLCISIRGGMKRSLEHGGAKDVQITHHKCRSSGGDRCEFNFTWS
jgi:hypothetical protein